MIMSPKQVQAIPMRVNAALEIVREIIRSSGIELVSLDEEDCHLHYRVGGELRTISVASFAKRWPMAPDSDRKILATALKQYLPPAARRGIPISLNQAAGGLAAQFHVRAELHNRPLLHPAQGCVWQDLGQHVEKRLVYLETSSANLFSILVPPDLAKTWAPPEELFAMACENALYQNDVDVTSSGGLHSIGTGFDVIASVLTPKWIEQFSVKGKPVLLTACDNRVMLAGDQDIEGLTQLGAVGAATASFGPGVYVNRIVSRLDEHRWTTLFPGDVDPHVLKFAMARSFQGEYARQERLWLSRFFATCPIGTPATLRISTDSAALSSFMTSAMWIAEYSILLPRADFVVFADPRYQDPLYYSMASWNETLRVLGLGLRQVQCFPPRWYGPDFPTDEHFAVLKLKPRRFSEYGHPAPNCVRC